MRTVAEAARPGPDADPACGTSGQPSRRVRALGVETVVVPERGQWAVDIVVIMEDGIVRRRISTHRTEALARISASCIRRGAEREVSGPWTS